MTHARKNASVSTLRLSLGCLLSSELGIALRRVGTRLHFGPGEAELTAWLGESASVCWVEHVAPWTVEAEAISSLDLPLNLQHNRAHPFAPRLAEMRRVARVAARGDGGAV